MISDHLVRQQVAQQVWLLFTENNCTHGEFLHSLKNLIPELTRYSTLCDITPDLTGDISQPNEALVVAVFGPNEIQAWKNESQQLARRKTGEITKILLRLVYLRCLIRNDKSCFTSLSLDRFNKLRILLAEFATPEELLFLTLSLIFDALGRTKTIRDLVAGQGINDHDTYWRLFLTQYGSFTNLHQQQVFDYVVPSFKLLSEEKQIIYKTQVLSNTFNLGAFVQGESVPFSLYELIFSCDNYRPRIIVLIFPFISFSYNSQFEAVGFTNEKYDQFITAAEIILRTNGITGDRSIPSLQQQVKQTYQDYLVERAVMVRVPEYLPLSEDERYTLYRIIALSRATDEHWSKIWYVWRKLSEDVRATLVRFMTVSGFENEKAIYVYYAPAMIANTIKSAGTVEKVSLGEDEERYFYRDYWVIGLYYGLYKLSQIYLMVSNLPQNSIPFQSPHGAGAYIYYAKSDAVEMIEFNQILPTLLPADIDTEMEGEAEVEEEYM